MAVFGRHDFAHSELPFVAVGGSKMKKALNAICCIALLGCTPSISSDETESLESAGIDGDSRAGDAVTNINEPYFGQALPGLTPEVFAPGIVSTEGWECCFNFSPDMEEFYYIRRDENSNQVFLVNHYENGQWQEEVISPRVGEPFVSPDNRTMHLGNRYMERTEYGWSEIKELGGEFEDMRIMRLTVSSQGTYYFDEVSTDGDGVIRYSRLVDGVREAPRPASEVINTGTWLAHPFIAPDESYLLWDGVRDEGFGESDIYVSFRQQDGSWGNAINLGDSINTDADESFASVTPDGDYLFFLSNKNRTADNPRNLDVFWVDAQIVEDLRAE